MPATTGPGGVKWGWSLGENGIKADLDANWQLLDGLRASAWINVRDYGAVGDGVTDDSAAIQAACEDARLLVANDPSGGDRVSKKTIYFPAGVYLITQSECILPSTFTLKGRGYRLIGDGTGQTTIWFKPTSGSRILIHNNNAFLSSDVRDITFRSDSNLNTFYKALSEQPAGAVQRWSFERVEWGGAWGKGFELYGNNNNSEYRWEDCGVGGEMGTFLYTPPSISSDQHLNFWFDCMKFWPTVGAPSTNCFCELNLGGSVVIDKSDFSGLQSGTLFKLKGSSHAQGVCHFACNNTRFELKSDNVKVLDCEWPQGVVSFNKCDFSSQRPTYSQDTEAFGFTDTNVGGASAIFDGCSLIGSFRFITASDDFRYKKHAAFIGCNFQQVDIFDAIKYTSPTNSGGRRPVEFRNCRGSGTGMNTQTSWAASTAYTVGTQRRSGSNLFEVVTAGTSGSTAPTGKGSSIADGSVVWKWVRAEPSCYANDAIVNGLSSWNPAGLARRVVSFKGATAGLPSAGGTLNIILPVNAVMVRAYLFSPAGAVTSLAVADYTIRNEQDTPTVFANISSTPASAGFSAEWNGFFPVGTDIKKRSLILAAAAGVDQINTGAFAIVEYIA